MEPWMWKQMLWTVGFLGITYVPLQCVVLWKCRGAARLAAAFPLLFMVPMIIAGLQPAAYQSGSLYGMFFICPYLPAMIYLVAVASAGPRVPNICPHCGHKVRVKSFQMTRSSTHCAKCGNDLLVNFAIKPEPASEPFTSHHNSNPGVINERQT